LRGGPRGLPPAGGACLRRHRRHLRWAAAVQHLRGARHAALLRPAREAVGVRGPRAAGDGRHGPAAGEGEPRGLRGLCQARQAGVQHPAHRRPLRHVCRAQREPHRVPVLARRPTGTGGCPGGLRGQLLRPALARVPPPRQARAPRLAR
ncbi:unnamed protein product, partial [Heterosigma akashiwo]